MNLNIKNEVNYKNRGKRGKRINRFSQIWGRQHKQHGKIARFLLAAVPGANEIAAVVTKQT